MRNVVRSTFPMFTLRSFEDDMSFRYGYDEREVPRTHHCPACRSWSRSAETVAAHYRKYHAVGATHAGTWPGIGMALARNLDEEPDWNRILTEYIPRPNRPGLKSPREAAIDKIAHRADAGRGVLRKLQDQGVSKRRAAEMIFLARRDRGEE